MKKILALVLVTFFISGQAFSFIVLDSNRKTVTTAGTAEALGLSTSQYDNLTICAETNNTGVITVGNASVVGAEATRKGVPLSAGDCYTIKDSKGSLADIYLDTTVNGDGVTYTSYTL